MADEPASDRQKVTTRLTPDLWRQVKARAAQLGIDLQDAVAEALAEWTPPAADVPDVDTSGAESYSAWLPPAVYPEFQRRCVAVGVSYQQGLHRAITLWLITHRDEDAPPVLELQRIVVVNQQGGVGKTLVAGRVAEALAELGRRVLVIDYDPQGHLTLRLGLERIKKGSYSLTVHMSGEVDGDLRDLIVTLPHERFGGRLHVLPASTDAFLLDIVLSRLRSRERALERALRPLEDDYDDILVDCAPSLGFGTDAALYYARDRGPAKHAARPRRSGVLVPVLAEDSSPDAFMLLLEQIDAAMKDMEVTIHNLGLVVNRFDARRGKIVTRALKVWQDLGTPRVVGVVPDLKEEREAVAAKLPLLDYAPDATQSAKLRDLARALS
jgi:chromosome partitioning protein